MNFKETKIVFPVFSDYTVHVEVTTDMAKSAKRHTETEKVEVVENMGAMAVHVSDEPQSFVFLPYNATPGAIAHESWHVIRNMMKWAGIELDSETCAYHLGYLVQKVYKFVRGRRK